MQKIYKLYYQLIKNNFKKFILIYVFSTTLIILTSLIFQVINNIFAGPTGGVIGEYIIYLFGYLWSLLYFLIILLYSQLFKVDRKGE